MVINVFLMGQIYWQRVWVLNLQYRSLIKSIVNIVSASEWKRCIYNFTISWLPRFTRVKMLSM